MPRVLYFLRFLRYLFCSLKPSANSSLPLECPKHVANILSLANNATPPAISHAMRCPAFVSVRIAFLLLSTRFLFPYEFSASAVTFSKLRLPACALHHRHWRRHPSLGLTSGLVPLTAHFPLPVSHASKTARNPGVAAAEPPQPTHCGTGAVDGSRGCHPFRLSVTSAPMINSSRLSTSDTSCSTRSTSLCCYLRRASSGYGYHRAASVACFTACPWRLSGGNGRRPLLLRHRLCCGRPWLSEVVAMRVCVQARGRSQQGRRKPIDIVRLGAVVVAWLDR